MRFDLHIHAFLSPCASLEMSPRAIARRASEAGLDAVALCDHNSARNTPAAALAMTELVYAALPPRLNIARLFGEQPVVCSSDAHELQDIGTTWNEANLPDFSVASLREALAADRVHCIGL